MSKPVPCPRCKVDVGESCRNPDGSLFAAGIHMARYYAVHEEKQTS